MDPNSYKNLKSLWFFYLLQWIQNQDMKSIKNRSKFRFLFMRFPFSLLTGFSRICVKSDDGDDDDDVYVCCFFVISRRTLSVCNIYSIRFFFWSFLTHVNTLSSNCTIGIKWTVNNRPRIVHFLAYRNAGKTFTMLKQQQLNLK